MVWIHGGGFNEGFGGARQYNPSTLVKEGGIVVVTINYRVGTLGLLATKSLDDADGELSGNYAIRDQQAALRWVQKNIGAFGGDPGNVTIAGESAGGASVLALVSSPASKGLFHRAIAQSPPWDSHVHARAANEKTGAELAGKLGCRSGPEQAACLRQLPVEAILKIRGEVGMVEDPKLLPVDTFVAFRDGTFNRVPLIIGSNLHEGYFSTSGLERRLGHAMSETEFVAQMRTTFGVQADEFMKQYPPGAHASPAAAMGEAVGDSRFACYADLARSGTAKYTPVYGFEMNEPNPVQQQPRPKFSLDNTSYHTSDLAYLFDNDTNGPLTGEAATLGRKMRAYWLQFIRTGSPNTKGLPAWPQFNAQSGTLLNLSNAGGVTGDFAARHRCDALMKSGPHLYGIAVAMPNIRNAMAAVLICALSGRQCTGRGQPHRHHIAWRCGSERISGPGTSRTRSWSARSTSRSTPRTRTTRPSSTWTRRRATRWVGSNSPPIWRCWRPRTVPAAMTLALFDVLNRGAAKRATTIS